MTRRPPRPLRLPEVVSNPQTRTDYVLANPPKYGPSSSRSSSHGSDSPYPRVPPSPTSTNDADSHRASSATFASLTSPVTPASSRTSLSIHNLSLHGDTKNVVETGDGHLSMPGNSGEGKSWTFGRLSLGGGSGANQRPRASWSTAFVNTKSWFASSAPSPPSSASSQKEIKLSPSMIAASASAHLTSNRPISSPYPSTSDPLIVSPTDSALTTRPPKVGTGLRYYTERNPAPENTRVQIPDPTDIPDHDLPQFPRFSPHQCASGSASACTKFCNSEKELLVAPDLTDHVPSPTLRLAALKELGILHGEGTGPLSPPPTPPVHEREGNVPRIRISSGDDSS